VLDIDAGWASISWLISVSSDNVTFSDETAMFVFDSRCLVCRLLFFLPRAKDELPLLSFTPLPSLPRPFPLRSRPLNTARGSGGAL